MAAATGSHLRTAFFATATVFFGAVIATLAKLAGPRVPVSEQIFLRSLLCLAASPLLGGTGLKALGQSKHYGWLLIRGILGFFASYCHLEAARRMPLFTVALVTRMHLIVGPAMALVFSGERATLGQVLGYLVGLVGISAATPQDTWRATSPMSFGFNYIMATTVSVGLSFFTLLKLTRFSEDQAAVRASFHLCCLVGSMVMGCLLRGAVQPTLPELGFIAAGAAAICGMQWGLSHLFENWNPFVTVPCLFLAVAFNAVFGMLLLGADPPNQQEALGAALVFLALALGCLVPFLGARAGGEKKES